MVYAVGWGIIAVSCAIVFLISAVYFICLSAKAHRAEKRELYITGIDPSGRGLVTVNQVHGYFTDDPEHRICNMKTISRALSPGAVITVRKINDTQIVYENEPLFAYTAFSFILGIMCLIWLFMICQQIRNGM